MKISASSSSMGKAGWLVPQLSVHPGSSRDCVAQSTALQKQVAEHSDPWNILLAPYPTASRTRAAPGSAPHQHWVRCLFWGCYGGAEAAVSHIVRWHQTTDWHHWGTLGGWRRVWALSARGNSELDFNSFTALLLYCLQLSFLLHKRIWSYLGWNQEASSC